MDHTGSTALFFAKRPLHRCIAAREADLAASAKDPAAKARHRARALRHRRLAEAECNEDMLILR